MDKHVFTGKFNAFFDSIRVKGSDIEAYFKNLGSSLNDIKDEIHLGKFNATINAPKNTSLFDYNGEREVFESEDGFDFSSAYLKDFFVDDRVRISFAVYPVKDYKWDKDEELILHAILGVIFISFNNVSLSAIVEKMATSDVLTGVFNVNGLAEYSKELTQNKTIKEYSGCMCNIKNFRYVNEQVGAKKGDQILKSYAKGIDGWLEGGERIARINGDSFVVLVKNERVDSFLSFISNFRVRLKLKGAVKEYAILSRVGIYEFKDGGDLNQMMSGTAVALAAARASSTGIVHFEGEMLDRALHAKEISILFPKSLRNGEFEIYYQPKVDLRKRKMCGCEALVRWFKKGRRIVPPEDFVPVLEREGSVCSLDFYVFRSVCKSIREWLDRGMEPVRISVNFSKIHLHNSNIVEDILEVMDDFDVEPKYIEIELTERTDSQDFDVMYDFVKKMKENGISVSIDDFGTGYSSLNLLKDLDVDVIKLDKSFLDDITSATEASKDKIVVKNIVKMVKELDMDIIAEGVETKVQAEFLKKIKCNVIQGFLFDRPLPIELFEQRLKNKVYPS